MGSFFSSYQDDYNSSYIEDSELAEMPKIMGDIDLISENMDGELRTVENLNIKEYLGLWYEISRTPNFFQANNQINVTAEYSLKDDGDIKVLNTGYTEGVKNQIEGNAKIDPESSSKLLVTFFPGQPAGNYWIVKYEKDYSLVTEPKKEQAWILSRNKTIPQEKYKELTDYFSSIGVNNLMLTLQE